MTIEDTVELTDLPKAQLEEMLDAGENIVECYRILAKSGTNVVAEVLRHQGDFTQFNHYPEGDVFDPETHSQHYYHAHQKGEHGHFHCYLREAGMPEGCEPTTQSHAPFMDGREDKISHLIAISMNNLGFPSRLFTTNRWSTADHWYKADDVIKMLDVFEIDVTFPSWPLNIWLTNMVRLFRPQIEKLIRDRDEFVAKWQDDHPDLDALEDRNCEIPSMLEISVEDQIGNIEIALDLLSQKGQP